MQRSNLLNRKEKLTGIFRFSFEISEFCSNFEKLCFLVSVSWSFTEPIEDEVLSFWRIECFDEKASQKEPTQKRNRLVLLLCIGTWSEGKSAELLCWCEKTNVHVAAAASNRSATLLLLLLLLPLT